MAQLHSLLQITHSVLLASSGTAAAAPPVAELRKQFAIIMRSLRATVHNAAAIRAVTTAQDSATLGGAQYVLLGQGAYWLHRRKWKLITYLR